MSSDYKQKYKEVVQKLVESTDVAYRLGYEAGMKQARQDNMMQQQAQQQQAMMQQQAAMIGQVPGQDGQQTDESGAPMQDQGQMPGQAPMEGQQAAPMGEDEEMSPEQGSELDQHIGELENLVSKGEKPKVSDLRKIVTELSNLRKSQKEKFKNNEEQVSSSQRKVVSGILKKWEEENKSVMENLEDIIAREGLKIND
jgi:hypothetical protein